MQLTYRIDVTSNNRQHFRFLTSISKPDADPTEVGNPSVGAGYIARRSMCGALPQSNRCSALTASARQGLAFELRASEFVFNTSINLHLRDAGADRLILDSKLTCGVRACSKS